MLLYSLRAPLLILLGCMLMLVVLYVVNPFLPEWLSLGVTQQSIEEVSDDLTITYDIPTDEAVAVATSFDGYLPEEQLVKDPVDIPLPLDVVSQEYITTFNKVVNQAILLEAHLKNNVQPAMNLVQTEAAAGNWVKLFEHMADAREQITVLDRLNADFNASMKDFKTMYMVAGMNVSVRKTSEALGASGQEFYETVKKLGMLLEQSVSGSVPSQQLVTDIETTNAAFTKTAEEFSTGIANVGVAVKAAR